MALRIFLCVLFANFVCGPAYSEKLKSRNYHKNRDAMGVVLLDINWGRAWDCGGFENAQLTNLVFDRIPLTDSPIDKYSSIQLKSPSRLFVDPEYISYGFIVHPGEYALTDVTVKAARSVSDVGYLRAEKEMLVDGEEYLGGTLQVDAGEVIYIGHFGLDCLETPMLWRYYAEGWESFDKYRERYKKKFKFLSDADILYRLFETESFGQKYELPPR